MSPAVGAHVFPAVPGAVPAAAGAQQSHRYGRGEGRGNKFLIVLENRHSNHPIFLLFDKQLIAVVFFYLTFTSEICDSIYDNAPA